MQLTIQNMNSLISLYRNLKDFPGLEKYQREIKDLKAASEFAQGYMGEIFEDSLEVEQASGLKFNLLKPEQADTANDWLKDSLKDVKNIMADKELMEKEPFLKSYLGTYKMQMNRAFSDRDDALDYYADDTAHIVTFITDQFDKIPTGQEYQQMPEHTKQTADKIMNFMEAYSDCYEFQGQVQNAMKQNPGAVSDAKYRQAADQKMEKLQEATQRIAEIPKNDVEQFFRDTGNTYSIHQNVDMLYDSKKHSPGKAAEQIADRRKQLQSHITPVEARLLENFGGQVKGIVGTAFGMGAEPLHLPQPYRELSEGIIKLGEDCRQKLKDGFQSEAEKLDFFKNLGSQTKAFCDGVDHAKLGEENLTAEQNNALVNISKEFRNNAGMDIGALSQAMKMDTKIRNAEHAASPEFAGQMKQFYDMMQATGEGYFGHKNSPEYTKMMNTAKVVTELAGKSPLNDVQREALGDSFGKLSKDCQAYLAKAGVGKKSREVGEDRFAGALGILNLVDKESAERVRTEAQAKRKTEVTFDGLQQRAQQKATERELSKPQMINQPEPGQPKAEQAAPKQAEVKNAAQKKEEPRAAEPEKKLNGVEQARKQVNDWYEKLKAVDYNMLGKGSPEFREAMESMEELKNFADTRLKSNGKGNIDLDNLLDFHDREAAAIGKLQTYLNHKEDQIKADPKRRDDPKMAKREQPRIRAAIGLLEEMKNSQAEREKTVVTAMQEQARPRVEKLLAGEETKREAAGISHEDFVKSTYRSIEMIRNLDGNNWSMERNENLRHFCDRVQSYTDEKRYDKSLQAILDDRNNSARPVLKEADKLFKGDKKNPEAFPGGVKLSNAQLTEKYAKLRSEQGTPYLGAKDIKRYDLKEKKAQIQNENKQMKETMIAQPKKQAERTL